MDDRPDNNSPLLNSVTTILKKDSKLVWIVCLLLGGLVGWSDESIAEFFSFDNSELKSEILEEVDRKFDDHIKNWHLAPVELEEKEEVKFN